MNRNRNLLDLARGQRCLMMAVEACRMDEGSTTVAAHQNMGKGMGLKQHDNLSVWACGPCHTWYDQSGAPREEKRRAFDAAYKRQISEWQKIVRDMSEKPRDRAAAMFALEMLRKVD